MDRPVIALPRVRTRTLLSQVPTQRVKEPRPTSRKPVIAAVLAGVLVLGGTIGTAVAQERNHSHEALASRVESAQAAVVADAGGLSALYGQTVALTASDLRISQIVTAQTALAEAESVLASSPHADDVPVAQLNARVDGMRAMLDAGDASPQDLALAALELDQQSTQVQDQESAWQTAEQARIAEQEAQAAAAAAAAAAAVRNGGTVPQAAVPAVTSVPAGGKTCMQAGSGGSSSSATAIGDAINAYRAANGLPTVSVTVSGTLSDHAIAMANAGGIWHSGADNIVGCVSNGSPETLVAAWSRSAPHNAQMLRTDITAMSVGGAIREGWLYGAAAFR